MQGRGLSIKGMDKDDTTAGVAILRYIASVFHAIEWREHD